MAKAETKSLAILGAGPIGIEAALYARKLGLTVAVYEQGQVGEYVQRWGHALMFTPFGMNVTPLGRAALGPALAEALPPDGEPIAGNDFVLQYLIPLAESKALKECLHLDTKVIALGREGVLKSDLPGQVEQRGKQKFRLLLRPKQGPERIALADAVFDCTGCYGQHRWLGIGGIPAPGEMAAEAQIQYGLEDVAGAKKAAYAGKTVVLVGSGYSAATQALALASLAKQSPDTWVIWLARSARSQPLYRISNDPFKERERIAVQANHLATRGEGNIEFHPNSPIVELLGHGPDKGIQVTAMVNGQRRTWEADRLLAMVGHRPDVALTRELQLPWCAVNEGGIGEPPTIQPPQEPNYFALGMRSRGRNGQFLLRDGHAQIRAAFAKLMGQMKLDHYPGL